MENKTRPGLNWFLTKFTKVVLCFLFGNFTTNKISSAFEISEVPNRIEEHEKKKKGEK